MTMTSTIVVFTSIAAAAAAAAAVKCSYRVLVAAATMSATLMCRGS